MTAADAVGFHHEGDRIAERLVVNRNRHAVLEGDLDEFGFNLDVVAPEGHAHNRIDDLDVGVEMFEILGFMSGAEHVGVGRIGLLSAHAVVKAFFLQEGGHFSAAAEFLDEGNVEPGLINFQARIGEQPVAVEALNVVALIGRTVTPDVHAVFTHGGNEHRTRYSAAERRGVEVELTARRNMESTGLNSSDAFVHKLRTAVDQTGFFGAVFHCTAGNRFVIGLIGLSKVGRIGIGKRALGLHPAQRAARIEAARERDTDLFANRHALQNRLRHVLLNP